MITSKLDLDDVLRAPNVCDLLTEEECKYIGQCALDGYMQDKESRREWEKRNATAMELALQVVRQKTFPWPNASNVKFPIITVAALQYQARAYPALVDTADLVKAKVYGDDPDGQKTARAERISAHMSWQNIEQDCGWEEAHDKGLLVQAIAGNAFIKKTFDAAQRRNVTKLVLPENFVTNYYTKDIESSERYTHTFILSENDIRQREIIGLFCEYEEGEYQPKSLSPDKGPLEQERDERQGLTEPGIDRATPYFTGEQYCWWDLDGDGYAEPYIVTFDLNSGCVRRIVARFLGSSIERLDGQVYCIKPVCVFTKIPFIPSPDGGFYDIGLGALLGPLNESVNTALNQIFDAGTMATLGGGFTGRGFKGRGGPFSMRPFEWYPVDAPGDDIRKNILPLPVREPSNVLFQVLGLLIQYAERVVGATDIQLGENPGQNTPAETTRTLNENGSRVYNAIYKRTWRAFSDEFDIQYDLNQKFLEGSQDYYDLVRGKGAMLMPDDYRGPRIYVCPAADPYVVSDTQRVQQATALLQASQQLPGFNRYQAGLRWLKALRIPNIEAIYPQPMQQGPQGQMVPSNDFPPPPPDPKMITAQAAAQKVQLQAQEMQADQMRLKIEMMNDVIESRAKVQNLQAQAQLYLAQAGATAQDPAIKMIYAEIEAEGARGDRMLRLIDTMSAHMLGVAKLKVDAAGATGNGKDSVNLPGAISPADAIAQTNGEVLGSLQ